MATLLTASPPQAPVDFDLAMLLSEPKRENTITMADALRLHAYAVCSRDGLSPLSEQSIASSPVSLAFSDRAASVTSDDDSLSSWFSPSTASAMMSIPDELVADLDAFAFHPAPGPVSPLPMPVSQATFVLPIAPSKQDQDFEMACANLRGMAASGLPASSMLWYLHASRNGLNRDIPAEVLLQGLIELEKTRTWNPSSPSASSQDSSIGPQRRARRANAPDSSLAPYAIPAGPRMYKCDKCSLVFDRAYNLREHLKTHDPNCVKDFVCPLSHCPHASHRRADMHRHIKNVHIKKEVLTSEHKSLILAAYPAMRGDFAPPSKKRGVKSQ